MRLTAVFALMGLSACSGVAYSTTVAQSPATRLAMALSVVPGETTEKSFITRWGYPAQKVRDGGRVEYVYRDIRNFKPPHLPLQGDPDSYVIVTFQYGQAVGVRTSDGIDCRAAFNPRPTGYFFDNPTVTGLAGPCAPEFGKRQAPNAWKNGLRGAIKDALHGKEPVTEVTDIGGSPPPGVPDDSYAPGGKGTAAPLPAPDPVVEIGEAF